MTAHCLQTSYILLFSIVRGANRQARGQSGWWAEAKGDLFKKSLFSLSKFSLGGFIVLLQILIVNNTEGILSSKNLSQSVISDVHWFVVFKRRGFQLHINSSLPSLQSSLPFLPSIDHDILIWYNDWVFISISVWPDVPFDYFLYKIIHIRRFISCRYPIEKRAYDY